MDVLDVILAIIVVAAAARGFRRGATIQVLSYAGIFAGLTLGVVLVLAICPHVSGEHAKMIVALLLLLVPAVLLAAGGRRLGTELGRRLRRARFGAIDAVAGAGVAAAGTLIVIWALSSILVNSQYGLVARQIYNSRIVRTVSAVMPPIPSAIAPVEHFLSDADLPLVADGFVQLAGPVPYPTAMQVRAGAAVAIPSMVKIVAVGCNEIQEGSGFSVGRDLFVTNAHVVAGTHSIRVEVAGLFYVARPVLFDPAFDLAILRVPGVSAKALTLDSGYVGRGTEAVVVGYPGGGLLAFDPAAIRAEILAEGLDIYGQHAAARAVYVVQGLVRPGNSGGPLIEPNGLVVGVVFSRSPIDPQIGYALASPGVDARVLTAEALPTSTVVGTGACISD
jgi:S1-C subfamily serine protease